MRGEVRGGVSIDDDSHLDEHHWLFTMEFFPPVYQYVVVPLIPAPST